MQRAEQFVRIREIVELTANIALTIAIIVGLTVFAYRPHSILGNNSPSPQVSPLSAKIDLPGVDWKANKATLVVAISSTCHFCVNSTSFYSQLTHSQHKTPIVVVMPQDQKEARAFLEEHSIAPANTISADLANIQVQATPTLLLISSSGTITRSWVGELTQIQRKQVLDALNQI